MKAVTVFIVDQRDDKEALDFARAAVFEKNEHLDYRSVGAPQWPSEAEAWLKSQLRCPSEAEGTIPHN